jgi:hypothetical protein
MADGMLHPGFQEELRALLNRHSLDNACNTPDFILAGMLTEHLEAYRKTVLANMKWHEPKAIGQAGQMQSPVKGSEDVILSWASQRPIRKDPFNG